MPLKDQSDFINFLMEQNKMLITKNEELTKNVSELTAKVEELTKKIAELTEQKNKNSNNSSKPPSSDGLKKSNKDKSLREKTNNKQGGQPDHSASNLVVNDKPTHIEKIVPFKCQTCPMWENVKELLAKEKEEALLI